MAIWKRALTVSAARSTSRARRRLMQAQAKVRSMTQRLGWTTKPASVSLDDLDRPRGSRGDARPLVAAVREEALEEREAPGDPVEDHRRAVAILHAGGMDLDAQHQAEGVGDQVPLAALDPLSGVVSDHFAGLRAGFHALAVDDRRGRALVATLQLPGPAIEHVVDVRPDPGDDPGPEVAVDRAARRKILRQHSPLAARLQQVEDRVHHPPQAGRPRSLSTAEEKPATGRRNSLPPRGSGWTLGFGARLGTRARQIAGVCQGALA